MLEISQLQKTFGKGAAAVNDVSLSVKKGSIYSLIGPNGSGKTTIIKMVAGLLQPTSGSIAIDGVDVVEQPTEAKAKIGYIPDNPTVWGKMTGREFLHFTGALYGMEETERSARIKDLLPVFSLEEVGDMYFEYYSRGNRQKFTILAALLHEPELLLIDEPIIGLDPESVETLEELLTDFRDKGGAVLITTHMLGVADHVTDAAGVISAGSLKASGALEDLRSQANLSSDAPLRDIYNTYAKQNE